MTNVTNAMKERIIEVLKSKEVYRMLGNILVDGAISMSISKTLKLEIQEYGVYLIDRKTLVVVDYWATATKALQNDSIFECIEKYKAYPITINPDHTIELLGELLPTESKGIWTDGFKVIYFDAFAYCISLSDVEDGELNEITSIDLVDFDNIGTREELNKAGFDSLGDTIFKHILSKPEYIDIFKKYMLGKRNKAVRDKTIHNKVHEIVNEILYMCVDYLPNGLEVSDMSYVLKDLYPNIEIKVGLVNAADGNYALILNSNGMDKLKKLDKDYFAMGRITSNEVKEILAIIDGMLAELK